MKHLKKFNELRQYTQDEIDDLTTRNRKNYKTVIDNLCSGWKFSREIITAVVVAMHGSYDLSDEYLSDMDGYDYENPADYWVEWCKHHDIEHEIENNPFI